jgi:penicillin-binding protein 1A
MVTRITRADGTILYEHQHVQDKAISADTAATVSNILTGVVATGTGKRAQLGERPVAGKTGTTDDYRNAWFVGYTPQLSTAVWVGFPESQREMRPPNTSIRVFGGTYPAQIWQRFMSTALGSQPTRAFPPLPTTTTTLEPGSVTVVEPDDGLGDIVPVPEVVGLEQEKAAARLQDAGFAVAIAEVDGPKSKNGEVTGQSPAGGRSAPQRSIVTIEVVR